jgi:hypothetical protein
VPLSLAALPQLWQLSRLSAGRLIKERRFHAQRESEIRANQQWRAEQAERLRGVERDLEEARRQYAVALHLKQIRLAREQERGDLEAKEAAAKQDLNIKWAMMSLDTVLGRDPVLRRDRPFFGPSIAELERSQRDSGLQGEFEDGQITDGLLPPNVGLASLASSPLAMITPRSAEATPTPLPFLLRKMTTRSLDRTEAYLQSLFASDAAPTHRPPAPSPAPSPTSLPAATDRSLTLFAVDSFRPDSIRQLLSGSRTFDPHRVRFDGVRPDRESPTHAGAPAATAPRPARAPAPWQQSRRRLCRARRRLRCCGAAEHPGG